MTVTYITSLCGRQPVNIEIVSLPFCKDAVFDEYSVESRKKYIH